MKRLVLMLSAVVAFAPALFGSVANAQPAGGAEAIRGVVKSVEAGKLTLKPKSGPVRTIDLAPTWSVAVTKPIAVSDIKEGSFIGTAEIPKGEGVGRSLEVHVFPPGVKMGEGHYDWNLKKGSMMTNGTVGKVTAGAKGSRELQVSYSTGQRKIVVPAKVPVVQITGGDRSMVKPGVPVFLVAIPKPGGGGMIAGSVSVGVNGAAPPM